LRHSCQVARFSGFFFILVEPLYTMTVF
jgi:hypothetical protein